ncbi:MAG: DUF1223 domain-containing protein [Parvularculaceae bacterium]|nr:DUF1223 domain-containing protein [Parvularculaceae bacterium]
MNRACAVSGAIMAIAGTAKAQQSAEAMTRPVVVEMFLSQSCKQSPPAAEHFSEIGQRENIVALAWHVGYWDTVTSPESGAWADPFARPEFVERQKLYNMRIRRSAMPFTPQVVIDGVISAVGSKRETLEARITEARFLDEHSRPTPASLDLDRDGDGSIHVEIDGVGAPYDAYAVSFRPKAVTKIENGDNAGSTFNEINVVTGVKALVRAAEGERKLSFDAPNDGDDCAVLVQERGQGRVVAARYCSDIVVY